MDDPPPQPRAGRRRSPPLRILLGLLWATYGICLPFVLLFSVLLLLFFETLSGFLCGVALLAALVLPLAVLIARAAPAGKPRNYRPAQIMGVLFVMCLTVVVLLAPPGTTRPGSRVTSHFPGPASFARYSFWNLLPEIDQVKLGVVMAPMYDQLVDSDEARHIRQITMPIYREMQGDPDFMSMGSVCNYAWGALFGGAYETGHYYRYVPEHEAGRRLPVILFLQGATANFKSYLWVLKSLADREKCAVVCPTFDFGDWSQPGGTEAIERMRAVCAADHEFDASRIYLIGLSNGGLGVSRAGQATPQAYAGLVYLSGITESPLLSDSRFIDGWRGRDVLFLHGAKDDRIAMTSIESDVWLIEQKGVRVRLIRYEDEDHFLFFSQRERVVGDLAGWMEDVEKRTRGK
ncbi:MAG: hypothetical protein HYY93_00295 [Planctomycetes bacterium]|nr:hypothetical protein [Planctomycetota bacterium]